MLVLSRKRGERIVIGDGIVVEVLDCRGGKVRLGIRADRSVPVHRAQPSPAKAEATAEPRKRN